MAKKVTSTDAQAAFETLNAATVEYRKVYIARAEEIYMTSLVRMRQKLAENEMDLNKVAPYPRTNIGRKAYKIALAEHQEYTAVFETVPIDYRTGMSDSARLDGKCPWIVKEKLDAEKETRSKARRDANGCFDAYLHKLAGKIGKSIVLVVMSGHLWEDCKLVVGCRDGEEQIWNTHCIVNRSVYGKLFNQWPTRRQL